MVHTAPSLSEIDYMKSEHFSAIHLGKKLFQQYTVDQYAKIENSNLNYFRLNQDSLRADLYNGVADAIQENDMLVAENV